MQKKRPWMALVSLAGAALTTCFAQAASLGGGAHGAVLGQSLDYGVAVRLDPGETLAPECVSAEVSIGDRRLTAGMVRVLLEAVTAESARLRVLTNQVIDEPVVSVQITANCGNRVSRRYVVLADPPSTAPLPASPPSYAAAPPEVPAALAEGAAPGAVAAAYVATAAVVQERSVRRVASRAAPRADAREIAPNRAQRRAESRAARRRAAASTARTDAPKRAAVVAAGPRLRLDFSPPAAVATVAAAGAVDQALEAVAQAAVAARASASAASAAAERIAALERTVDQLRGDAKNDRELSGQLREQLSRSDTAAALTWPLAGAAAVLALLAVWLGLRLSATRRAQNQAWRMEALRARSTSREAEAADSDPGADSDTMSETARLPHRVEPVVVARTAPVPFVSSEFDAAQPAGGRSRAAPAWPPPAPSEHDEADDASAERAGAETAPQRLRVVSSAPAPGGPAMPRSIDSVSPTQATVALSHAQRGMESGTRDVSIEELLDLEQQAEFFVVLGQDEAAIDLLVEHLRHTGGGSPLPYLKLLEIYRRRGDRSDYERTRARFNHRFNAYAPDWEVDLQSGRTLADYPGVLPRLQAVWPRPLDSMAELEALLFRKSRGELFDLPAYREVLFLYALARDLLDRESADTGLVDLLLPLSDGGDFSSTSPAPYMDLGRDASHGHHDFEDRPTAPVDLDLTLDNDRPASIFDPLNEKPQQPRRR